MFRPLRALSITFAAIATVSAQAAPTDGYMQYTGSYYVQNWTTNVGSGCFTNAGVVTTIAQYGDQRCELRWSNWPNQNTYNQFEFDAMFDGATQNTAIHQIKSNIGGEVIYLQVQNPGTLRNDNGSVFATGMANQWFHVNSMFNPVTGDSSAYINGSLKVTRNYPTTDRQWYFKNGCYNNGLPPGGKSTASFKNFKNWVYVTNAPAAPAGLSASASAGQISLQWTASVGAIGYNVKRSVASGSGYVTLASIGTTNYTDTGVTNGTRYYYVVSATNTFGESPNSAEVNALPIDTGYQLGVAPLSQSINSGTSTNYTVSMSTDANFSGTVTFGVGGLPSGANANFNPPTLSAAGTTTLTVQTTTNTPGGNYTLTIGGTNGAFIVTTTAGLLLTGQSAAAGTLLWTAGSGTDTNWSTILNWTNPAAGGFGPPGANNSVVFTNTGSGASAGIVDNTVNGNFSVLSLQYSQSNRFHTTQIADGQVLTVGTNLTAGSGSDLGPSGTDTTAITGAGGTLAMNNTAGVVIVRQGTGTNAPPWSHRATLDLSGLGFFNASLARILVAGDGGNSAFNSREVGTMYLARTNSITASGTAPAINISDNPANGAGSGNDPTLLSSYFYLGMANSIFADSIAVGRSKTAGFLYFNPAFTNGSTPSVTLRGFSATPVGTFSVGDDSQVSNSNQRSSGVADFSGGFMDAKVGTAYIGRSMNGTNTGASTSATGTLTFDNGTFSVNTLEVAYQTSATGTGPGSTGTVNVNGNGLLAVSQAIELAHGSINSPLEQATLNINHGTVQTTNIFGGGGISVISLNSGVLDLQSTNPFPGIIQNISMLSVGSNGITDPALLENAAAISASNTIVVAANGTISGGTYITSPGLIVNGVLSPGLNGTGGITNSGPAILGAGGRCVVSVRDATAGPALGWTFLSVGGGIGIQASNANPFTVSVQTPTGLAADFNYSSSYDWVIATAASGITNFSPSDFTVDDSLFGNDLAGGYFYVRASGNSLILSFTNNHPPVAGTVSLYRTGGPMAIPLSSLASHWSDPDGDPVQFVSVNPSSAGGTNNVGSDGIFIYYTNASATADSLSYVVQDVRTNPPAIYQPENTVLTATGIVNIVPPPVFGSPGASGSALIMAGSGGIPFGSYRIRTSTNLLLPIAQWPLAVSNSFDGSGAFRYTNTVNTSQPQAYYLLQAP